MISIVNYGMGNLGSIVNMFKRLKVPVEIVSDPERLKDSTKILLPGVGAFDAAMQRIDEGGFREVLNAKALEEKVPLLGICLGMQLLTKESDEGRRSGLGWVEASTKKFEFPPEMRLKIPHMGWNHVIEHRPSTLTADLPPEPRFYFVHSYYVQAVNGADVVMKTRYGIEFDSIIQKDNIYGAQFHPEKSHKFGMKLLSNFAAL